MIDWPSVSAWFSRHEEGLFPLALAAIVSAPKELPWPFNKIDILNWWYGWLYRTILTYASMRGPQLPHAEFQQQTEHVKSTDAKGGTIEKATQITMGSSAAPPPGAVVPNDKNPEKM